MDKIFSIPVLSLTCALLPVSCDTCDDTIARADLQRAEATMSALYDNYSVRENFLLRENFPFDEGYKAGYLADEEQASRQNPYSYLWPFSGTLSAVAAIMESNPDYADTLAKRVLPGLEEYYDGKRKPHAYSSYIGSAPASDRFYDDNIWLGIDFTDLYMLTSRKQFLEKAEMIWRFIESGMDDRLGGGIYWCEQKKASKNACSNAPGAVLALKLYRATKDQHYLEQGKALYEWTEKHLKDTADCLYFDNIGLDGKVITWKFAYNSGQMVQAGALLYSITGEKRYLAEAQATAAGCHEYFFEPFVTETGEEFRSFKRGDVWFYAVMVRGLIELYGQDGNPLYVDTIQKNLDYAWEHSRSAEGLFNTDFKGKVRDERKWLLTQGAMAEMYARMALVQKDRRD